MHDNNKLLEQIDDAMGRQGLLEAEVPASQTDDLELNKILAKAAVQIRKAYNLDLKKAHLLHRAMMNAARAFMNLPSAAAGAALARRMEKVFGEAVAEEEASQE